MPRPPVPVSAPELPEVDEESLVAGPNGLPPGKEAVPLGGQDVLLTEEEEEQEEQESAEQPLGGASAERQLVVNGQSDMRAQPGDVDLDAPAQEKQEKQAANTLGGASAKLQLNMEALPKDIREALQSFDLDGDGSVDTHELIHAAVAYVNSKKATRRLAYTVASLLLLLLLSFAAIAGLMFFVVEVTKETRVWQGVLTAPGSFAPVQAARATADLPLGILPRMPQNFIDKLSTVRIRDPTGAIITRPLAGTYGNGTYLMLHTVQGDVVEIMSPARAEVQLTRGDLANFSICAACSTCASYDVVVDGEVQQLIDEYWADVEAMQLVGSAEMDVCRAHVEYPETPLHRRLESDVTDGKAGDATTVYKKCLLDLSLLSSNTQTKPTVEEEPKPTVEEVCDTNCRKVGLMLWVMQQTLGLDEVTMYKVTCQDISTPVWNHKQWQPDAKAALQEMLQYLSEQVQYVEEQLQMMFGG